jgi:hypothetical protein
MMLDTLALESKNWPNLANLHEAIKTNVILPQTILDFQEYYDKLQKLSFYAEQGDHEEMQRVLDNQTSIEHKN